MDKRIVEKFAVNAVEESMLDSDILLPEIAENDKTLSWDGFIEVYKNCNKTKENFDGKVGVQVKGTMNNNHSKTISFPAETADLRNYLNNGGVIYFVVRIHKEHTSERKVYYASLPPVKLKQYLDGVKKQKTKTIKLKEYPSNKDERTSIIVNFLEHSRRQASYVNSGFISLDEIREKGYSYTIHGAGYGKKDVNPMFSAVLGREVYAYVTLEDSRVSIPVDTPLTIHELSHRIDQMIYVGDKCYYDSYKQTVSTEGITIEIGDGITLAFGQFKSNKVKTHMCFSPFLRKAAKDMRFVVDALNANSFKIGSMQLGLNSFQTEDIDFMPVIQGRLSLFEQIIDLFKILNVNEDLNIDTLTQDEQENIETLIKAFVRKENITSIATCTPTSALNLKISNITLQLIIIKNEDDTHTIQDFFNSVVTVFYKDEKGNQQITSPYSTLSKDDYLIISNINYDDILGSYKQASNLNPNIYDRANADMLQMLLSYDQKPNGKLLNVVRDVSRWILSESTQTNKNIHTLNYLQAIKRERAFHTDEIRKLYEIAESEHASRQEKIGAYLLLDNNAAAEIHLEKLTHKEQDDFKQYPIFSFYNSSKVQM